MPSLPNREHYVYQKKISDWYNSLDNVFDTDGVKTAFWSRDEIASIESECLKLFVLFNYCLHLDAQECIRRLKKKGCRFNSALFENLRAWKNSLAPETFTTTGNFFQKFDNWYGLLQGPRTGHFQIKQAFLQHKLFEERRQGSMTIRRFDEAVKAYAFVHYVLHPYDSREIIRAKFRLHPVYGRHVLQAEESATIWVRNLPFNTFP